MQAPNSTSSRNIALAILAALIAAFQIGKAIVALPLLQGAPLHLGLSATGAVLSALAIIEAILGMPLGLLISRFDARWVLCAGLAIIAASSLAGAWAGSVGMLLLSRVTEGVAVVAILVCASSVVGRQASAKDRDLAMALSSTAVPTGIALMIFATTLAGSLGFTVSWPMLWLANAVFAIACLLMLIVFMPAMPPVSTGAKTDLRADVRAVATARGPQFIALCFGLYATVYFAFSGFLPLLLRDLLGLSATQAGYASAGIVAVNVVGNICAGTLMRRGVAPGRIMMGGFVVGVICLPALLWLHMPAALAVAVAAMMISCMGSIPGSLTAVAPRVAPNEALVAPTIGFMLQGSYVGQLVGPMAAGALAQAGGWSLVAWMLLPLALGGVLLARRL